MTQEQMLKQIEFMTKLLEEAQPKMTYSEAAKKEDRITNMEIIRELRELRKKQSMTQQNSIQCLVENAEDFFGHLLAPSIIEEAEKIHQKEIQTAFELGKMGYPSNAEDYYNDFFKKADDDMIINEEETLKQAAQKLYPIEYTGRMFMPSVDELYNSIKQEAFIEGGKWMEKECIARKK
jgi:hypothetical protein